MSQQNLNKIYGQVAIVEEVSGATTLDKYDTGKVLYINGSTPFAVTLPDPSTDLVGWNSKLLVKDSTAAVTVQTGSAGTVTVTGSIVGTAVTFAANTITISTNTVKGDTVDVTCTEADASTATFVFSAATQA